MDVFLVGFEPRRAHAGARSIASGTPEEIQARLAAARFDRRLEEVLVLSTCRRLEWYVVADAIEAAEAAVRDLMSFGEGRGFSHAATPTYRRAGPAARLHLCRVACGLESMIVGEAEVQGQVRRAAALARDARTLGSVLRDLVGAALRAARRSRAETGIGLGATSAATAAVMLGRRAFGRLDGRSALVIGAGTTGRQAIARLSKEKLASLVVTSRSLCHATEAAAKVEASAVPLEECADAVASADLVIAATYAVEYLVTRETLRRRLETPSALVLVDLSVPPVIEPGLGLLPGVSSFTLDDAGEVVAATARRRLGEIPRVEAIALDESLSHDREAVAV